MSVAAAYLALGALVTAGFGIAYLARSDAMARMVGIALPSASARADYRAIYGGAQIGVGLFFGLAAWRPEWRAAGLAALCLFALGFGLARLGSLAVDRARHPQWIVGTLETIAGVGAAWLLVSIA